MKSQVKSIKDDAEFGALVSEAIADIAKRLIVGSNLTAGEDNLISIDIAIPFRVKLRMDASGEAQDKPEVCCICTRAKEGDIAICRGFGSNPCCS